jgi:hypothetical protein
MCTFTINNANKNYTEPNWSSHITCISNSNYLEINLNERVCAFTALLTAYYVFSLNQSLILVQYFNKTDTTLRQYTELINIPVYY